jgi:hypothetical protein
LLQGKKINRVEIPISWSATGMFTTKNYDRKRKAKEKCSPVLKPSTPSALAIRVKNKPGLVF